MNYGQFFIGGTSIMVVEKLSRLTSCFDAFRRIVLHKMLTRCSAIDVVKTRIQIDPAFARSSMLSAGRSIIASEGPKGLLTGFGPTAVGYLVQGGAKFSGYEFFADILLTPLEATRIRLVSDRTYASGLVTGFTRLAREGGLQDMYAGFLPILCKQIPYAIGQFTINEFCHELAFQQMTEERKRTLSPYSRFGIALGSGIVAGFAAAILSHPADTLLSQINKGHGPKGSMTHRLVTLSKQIGPVGIWAGLGPRMIMTAGLVAGQFIIYGGIKEALHAPPGIEIHKGDD
ncbi:hypothetical protein Clacol_001051 [Clathrus columnatus]|uniref:Mitochondrial phosphate carrier protein n=1 Tax=Clathrus columnatus TaxID=1419009 RepID=A0AAV4ZYD0_9AGAM|nr:hypothetical protein Clacol_001051 [Clathrus columnatus]